MISARPTQATTANEERATRLVPLCVDLDGTLVRGNTFLDSLIAALVRQPLRTIGMMCGNGFRQAPMWAALAKNVDLDVSTLPYREEVVTFLIEQKRDGHELVLATGANCEFAQRVADHLGLFSRVMASDAETHLVGGAKRDALVVAFGSGGFDYLGDSKKDRCVWAESRQALAVGPAAVGGEGARFARVFERERGGWTQLPVACRVHHWIKNLLVFLPVFLAHKLLDVAALKAATLAFLAFSLCASAVYLVNDVVDLQADRAHGKKRHRPIAAGLVSIPQAMAAAALLMAVSAAIAFRAGTHFVEVLGCYLLTTLLYSWRLKRQVLLDVFVLAGLYTVRVLAGGVATRIVITPWTAAFCIFLFLSLALLKRHSDLVLTGVGHSSRGYRESDIGVLSQFGIASGYLAALVLALYINNPDVHGLYRHPYWLWAACPILCYWISRMWLLSQRGELDTDPVVFALRDRATWIAFAITCASMLLAQR